MTDKIDFTKKENRILSKILEKQASINSEKIFLAFDDKNISFANAYLLVKRYTNGLTKAGVKAKQRICLYMDTCPEFIYLSFAINKVGAHWIPVNTDYKGRWLKDTLTNSDPEIFPLPSNGH